jgi:hypothetical protein
LTLLKTKKKMVMGSSLLCSLWSLGRMARSYFPQPAVPPSSPLVLTNLADYLVILVVGARAERYKFVFYNVNSVTGCTVISGVTGCTIAPVTGCTVASATC